MSLWFALLNVRCLKFQLEFASLLTQIQTITSYNHIWNWFFSSSNEEKLYGTEEGGKVIREEREQQLV